MDWLYSVRIVQIEKRFFSDLGPNEVSVRKPSSSLLQELSNEDNEKFRGLKLSNNKFLILNDLYDLNEKKTTEESSLNWNLFDWNFWQF